MSRETAAGHEQDFQVVGRVESGVDPGLDGGSVTSGLDLSPNFDPRSDVGTGTGGDRVPPASGLPTLETRVSQPGLALQNAGSFCLPGVVTDCHSVPDFEPSLVERNRKYMFTAPQAVNAYLERFFRVRLPEEQRRSIHEAHPRPGTDVCYPPKVDKNILCWAG